MPQFPPVKTLHRPRTSSRVTLVCEPLPQKMATGPAPLRSSGHQHPRVYSDTSPVAHMQLPQTHGRAHVCPRSHVLPHIQAPPHMCMLHKIHVLPQLYVLPHTHVLPHSPQQERHNFSQETLCRFKAFTPFILSCITKSQGGNPSRFYLLLLYRQGHLAIRKVQSSSLCHTIHPKQSQDSGLGPPIPGLGLCLHA